MRIKGLEGLNGEDIKQEIIRGGRFILYHYCFSLLFVTFRRNSTIYFIRSSENPTIKGLKFSLFTFIFGWWGFPFGPIFTIQSILKNLHGGTDVTAKVLATISEATFSPGFFSEEVCEEE